MIPIVTPNKESVVLRRFEVNTCMANLILSANNFRKIPNRMEEVL